MIRHVVLWKHKDGIGPEEREKNAVAIKAGLEALRAAVKGVVSIDVTIAPLPSSNADIMLDSLFVDADALRAYQEHPEHKRVGTLIVSSTQGRTCMDFIVQE